MAAADLVLGKPTFFEGLVDSRGVFPAGFGGIHFDGARLFISDPANHRVLILDSVPAADFAGADRVLGQGGFTTSEPNLLGTSASTLSQPIGVYSDGIRLYVCDAGNHRVLIWDTNPLTSGAPADHVLGQPVFFTNLPNRGGPPGANTLDTPQGVYATPTRLFVSDTNNHRILVWDLPIDFSSGEGPPADHVLGQVDFVSNLRNRTGSTTPLASTLRNPRGLFADGSTLLLADSENNRVLQWDLPIDFSTGEGPDAQRVIGQPDFTSATANNGGRGLGTMNRPYGVWAATASAYVADRNNHRVLLWSNPAPPSSTAAALVLGQPDGMSGSANSGGVSASSLWNPVAVASAGTRLLIFDQANNRVKVHGPFPSADDAPAQIVFGQRNFTDRLPNHAVVDDRSFRVPAGVASDGALLFFADRDNNRVLGWSAPPIINEEPADLLFGQAAFTDSIPATSATALRGPTDVAYDASGPGRLFVADRFNHRVVVYDGPFGMSQAASEFIGQSSATGFAPGTAQDKFRNPTGLSWDGTCLWVADERNHRILRFSNLTTAASADLVIGQTDFTSGNPNHTGAGDPEGDQSLDTPLDVIAAGGRLIVVDHRNHRALVWDPIPSTDDPPASLVLGQSSFSVPAAPGAGPSGLRFPIGVVSDGNVVAVSDGENHRLLIWDSFPTANGQQAARVIGQIDFLGAAPNTAGVSDRTLYLGTITNAGPSLTGTTLWLPDQKNGRVLRYDLSR